MLLEPVPAVLVETFDGWVLLDTGFNPALIKDPSLYRRFHSRDNRVAACLPDGSYDPLLEELERNGIRVDDLIGVAVSHLHNDHAGGLRHFAGLAPVYVQRLELEYGMNRFPDAEHNGIFRIDFDDPRLRFELLDGHRDPSPTEIFDGVVAIPTFGHTPGHQSFLVRFDESVGGGAVIFAFDAADLAENLLEELAVGGVIDCDPETTVAQIRKLKELAKREGALTIPGHDPRVWPALTDVLRESEGRWPIGLTLETLLGV
jgi:glyoxylase-like metal-dependent hydrolase (beta-lactamase superfamily II)